MNQLFYRNCKLILISLTSFWAFSAIATCPDAFSSEESNKEPIKEESSSNLTHKYNGIEDLGQLTQDVDMPSTVNALNKRKEDYTLIAKDLFDTNSMAKAYKKYQEERIKKKVSQNPDDYEFILIGGFIWFRNKHNSTPEDVQVVKLVLTEKVVLRETIAEINANHKDAIIKISSIWKIFNGSIDTILNIRKEIFDSIEGLEENSIQLIEKHFGHPIASLIMWLVSPVLTIREIQLLTEPLPTTKVMQPLLENPVLTTKTTQPLEQSITKQQSNVVQISTTFPEFKKMPKEMKEYIIQNRLKRKIIRILRLTNPKTYKYEDRIELDW